MNPFIILFLLLAPTAASGQVDCTALQGGDLRPYTGRGLSVYANDYAAGIVETGSGDCLALFQGESSGFSTVSRVFTFGINDLVYQHYWREFPGDVAQHIATDDGLELIERSNISDCVTRYPELYELKSTGYVNCTDVKRAHQRTYDTGAKFGLTVLLVTLTYIACGIVLAVCTMVSFCGLRFKFRYLRA